VTGDPETAFFPLNFGYGPPAMTSWLTRFTDPGTTARLGPLEWRVLETLWTSPDARSVRDLSPQFVDLAYTTLTSTLDRLCQKGLLDRTREGRSFRYQPRLTRHEFQVAVAADAVRTALKAQSSREQIRPLLSFFVSAIAERDPKLLDQLEAEVRLQRAKLTSEGG
jgi:predicted transcriptional regulator